LGENGCIKQTFCEMSRGRVRSNFLNRLIKILYTMMGCHKTILFYSQIYSTR